MSGWRDRFPRCWEDLPTTLPRVELRQLRYFVTVAEELNFARAAQRLHIAGPSLSQQIKALERDLKVQLFDRDRRSVALTSAGSALVADARALIEQADALRRRATGLAVTDSVRIGWVNWCPIDWAERAAGVAQLRVDSWVMPSHAQAQRVADGALDLAICWVQGADLTDLSLRARLVGVDRLQALGLGTDQGPVDAGDVVVLVDEDTAIWSSWNRYVEEFAAEVGARVVHIDDGGVAGPALIEHARRIGRPVLVNPKAQQDALPVGLVRRPVVAPTPLWVWSLVWRADDDRPVINAVIDQFGRAAMALDVNEPGTWLPADDPYRRGGQRGQ
jgi:DNA-binding transcriptional LysR family regulator